METGVKIALDLLLTAIEAAPGLVELITDKSTKTLTDRINRARDNIPTLIDTSGDDDERRKRLAAIFDR